MLGERSAASSSPPDAADAAASLSPGYSSCTDPGSHKLDDHEQSWRGAICVFF